MRTSGAAGQGGGRAGAGRVGEKGKARGRGKGWRGAEHRQCQWQECISLPSPGWLAWRGGGDGGGGDSSGGRSGGGRVGSGRLVRQRGAGEQGLKTGPEPGDLKDPRVVPGTHPPSPPTPSALPRASVFACVRGEGELGWVEEGEKSASARTLALK
jgi:hypothetical protein